MTFREGSDWRELIPDLSIPYIARCERVEDRETKNGQTLQWMFGVHEQATGEAVVKGDGSPLLISRMTPPEVTAKNRTRRFIEALLGQALSKEQLRGLLESGTLARRLKDRRAMCFIEMSDDGGLWPRINELHPLDNGKPPAMPASPPSPKRSYDEVFGSDDEEADKRAATADDSELPF